MRIVRQET